MPFLIGWAHSLCLPAIDLNLNASGEPMSGWAVLASGYLEVAALQFGWLANIALFGVLLGLSAWQMPRWWLLIWSMLLLVTTLDSFDIFLRPTFWQLKGAGPGFWLWAMTNLGAAMAGLVVSVRQGNVVR